MEPGPRRVRPNWGLTCFKEADLKKLLVMLIGLGAVPVWAQGTPGETPATTATTPAPMPVVIAGKWSASKVPWDPWFKDNAMVTDKTDYVHFFWNAQDFKMNFEVKDKQARLADAALELVRRLYPAGATADLVKVDIVYVLERDTYGQPKRDSLQPVAHLEFLTSKM